MIKVLKLETGATVYEGGEGGILVTICALFLDYKDSRVCCGNDMKRLHLFCVLDRDSTSRLLRWSVISSMGLRVFLRR